MQRTFSTFAHGWPGVGLLVLRTALGVPLLVEGGVLLSGWRDSTRPTDRCRFISIAAGAALQLGYSSRRGAIAGGIAVGAVHFFRHEQPLNLFSSRTVCFLAVSIAIALVVLGPGALSIDARLFGRRKIVIPSALSLSNNSKGVSKDCSLA
jgi:hypothetical protein